MDLFESTGDIELLSSEPTEIETTFYCPNCQEKIYPKEIGHRVLLVCSNCRWSRSNKK